MRACLCVALAFTAAGCSSNSNLGTVSGTVTLDGNPLPNGIVFFQPAHGRPSSAITDEAGRYALTYTTNTQGALIGKHIVHIRTEMEGTDGKPAIREYLPARYHENSELSAEVKAGHNEIDFKLTSD